MNPCPIKKRYLCERCGGTGQVDGPAPHKGTPNHPNGVCGLCGGVGNFWPQLYDRVADENERLRKLAAMVGEADRRFGHFAKLHNPTADATPVVLLGELAFLVREAAEAAAAEDTDGG